MQILLVRGPLQIGQSPVIPKQICTQMRLLRMYIEGRPCISREGQILRFAQKDKKEVLLQILRFAQNDRVSLP